MISALGLAGYLQNEDFKSQSDLESLGGNVSQLLNDTKIYLTADGLNKRLDQAIIDGDLAGGAGNDLNIATDPSFEKESAPGTCTNCVIDYETTGVHLASETNTTFARMTFGVSLVGDYEDTYTIDSSFNNKDAFLRIALRTTRADVNLEIYSNSNLKYQVAVSNDGDWHIYEIPFVTETTNISFKIDATSASTTAIDMDLINFGALPDGYIGNISQAHEVGYAVMNGATNCQPTRDVTVANTFYEMPLDADCAPWVVSGNITATNDTEEITILNARTDGVYTIVKQALMLPLTDAACVFSTFANGVQTDGVIYTSRFATSPLSFTSENQLVTRYRASAVGDVVVDLRVTSVTAGADCIIGNETANARKSSWKVSFEPDASDKIVAQKSTLAVVRGEGNAGTALTANVTPVNFTEVEDTNGYWSSNNTYTPDKEIKVHVSGAIFFNAAVTLSPEVYINGTIAKRCGNVVGGTTQGKLDCIIDLAAGDTMQVRVDVGATLSNASEPTIRHWIQIVEMPTKIKVAGVFRSENIKDGVSSPNSGTGKTKICSFQINSADECTNVIGGCISDCENTGTGVADVTFNTNYWADANSYHCALTGIGSQTLATISSKTATLMPIALRRVDSNALTNNTAEFICHGIGL